jgi:hypothetical protein
MPRQNALRTAYRVIEKNRSIKLATRGTGYATTATKMESDAKIHLTEIKQLLGNFTNSTNGYDTLSLRALDDIQLPPPNELTLANKVIKKNDIVKLNSKALDDIKRSDSIFLAIDTSLNQIMDWDNLMTEQLNNWDGIAQDKQTLTDARTTVQKKKVEIINVKNDMEADITSMKNIHKNKIDARSTTAQIIIGTASAQGTNLVLTASNGGTLLTSWDNDPNDLQAGWQNVHHVVDQKLFKFISGNNISSSDFIKRKKRMSQIKTFNTRNNNFSNKNFTMNNGIIKKINSHNELINMKLANNLIDKNCRNINNLATNLTDSIITYEDLSANIRLDGGGDTLNGYQTKFPINGKRSAIGLLSKPSQRDEVKKTVLFSLKNVIKKVPLKNCESPEKMNKIPISEPHKNIHEDEIHNHYFPITNKAYGQYIHRHKDNPHGSSGVPKHFFQHFTFRYAKNPRNINES